VNKIDISTWKKFKMSDVFIFSKGKRLIKENMTPGKLNYLGAISNNNAVRELIDQNPIHKGNCITVNYNGSVGEAFYQSEPFWATDDINILDLKEGLMTENIGLFLCVIIKQNKNKFGYGRKWTLDKMKNTYVLLPVKNQTIDYEFMKTYINNLNIKHIKTNNIINKNKLSTDNWIKYRIGDLFKLRRGSNINRDMMLHGNTPYVSAISDNNGVSSFANSILTFPSNLITINANGSIGESFFQKHKFIASGDVIILIPINFILNDFIGMFLTTILRLDKYKYSYGRKIDLSRLKNTFIKLPTKNNTPDWDYMENYIKSLPYADKI